MAENSTPQRFYRLPQHVARRRDLTSSAKVVFAAILYRIGDNYDCWPSIITMAQDAGISHTAVLRSIESLESKGVIVVSRPGNGQVNRYRIPPATSSKTILVGKGNQSRNDTAGGSETIVGPVTKRGRNRSSEEIQQENKAGKSSKKETRRQTAARRVVQAYIDLVGRPGDANTKQARRNVEKLLKAGHTEAELIACAGNYAAGDDFQDDPRYRYKASNFYGRAVQWEAYTDEARASKPTPRRIGCDSKQFAADLEAQGVIQPEEEIS